VDASFGIDSLAVVNTSSRTYAVLIAFLTFFHWPVYATAQSVYAENRKPAGNVQIDYTLEVGQPLSHLYDVHIAISGIRSASVDVAMPAWTPGIYSIMDYARNVQRFEAASSSGTPLRWEQTDKQTWRVAKAVNENVIVSYQVYSADLNDEMADLSPPATFMYVVGQKHVPVRIKYNVPANWQVYTGLERNGDHFQATDYDVFADAPALIGEFKVLHFEDAANVPYRVVFSNRWMDMTDSQVVDDLKDLADAATRVFGNAPYKEYTFLVKTTTAPAAVGIEHLNSSRITVGQDDFVNQSGYRRFLNNAAHHLIHTWNGKRIRPQAFAPLDYTKESYTRLLWFVEGVTNYYGDLLLVRSGLSTGPEFLSRLSLLVDALQHQPGRRLMTLEDASWNAWLRSDNSGNNSVSYGVKGEVVALLLDLEIRTRTRGQKSLDDVMRRLESDYSEKGIGMPEDGVERAMESVAGSSFAEFYDRVVRGKDELDYNRTLTAMGLRTDVFRQPSSIYFGIEFERAENNQVRLRRIVPNSPAQRAMLDMGDIIVAMDDERVTFDNLTSRIHSKRIGKPVALTVLRGERLLMLNLTPGESQEEQWSVFENANATPEQVRLRTSWLDAKAVGGQ
jgi:predicted metalloprotease with PDZ domain